MKNILSLCLQTTLKLQNFKQKKKKLIIKKEGIYFLLRKVYIVLPEELKYLSLSKNYIYIYYPIKINFPFNKNIISDTQENDYKLLFSKEELIEEVKFYLGIEKESKSFKFDIYDEKLNVITNDNQLTKNIKNIKTIINSIIYIKIIKLNEVKFKIRKKYLYNNKRKTLFINKINNKTINLNSENKSVNNFNYLLSDGVASDKENISCNKKYNNCLSCNRNKKLNEELNNIDSYLSNPKKINKNTNTDDLINKIYNIANNKESKNKYNNNKYFLYKSNTSDFSIQENIKGNLDYNINLEKYKKYMNNNSSNLSTPEYYQNMHKNNIKININKNNILKFPKKRNPFFNNIYINNILIKNKFSNYYHNGSKLVNLLTNKNFFNNNSLDKDDRSNLTTTSFNSFKSYINSKIRNKNNIKLNNIYLNKGLHSSINKSKNNIHLDL